jgi:peroxiredoxin
MDNVNRLRVGHFAPDFALKNSGGEEVRLSDFREKKGVLIFFCPGRENPLCLDLLESVNRLHHEISAKDIEILWLSPDERWFIRRIEEEKKLRFRILKIEDEVRNGFRLPRLTQQYGVEATESARGTPYPAVFLVDRTGIVRYRKVYTGAAGKPHPEELVCELNNLT